ncbi:MAG: sulfatase [Chitinophagaceae bacterium]
MKSVFIIPFLFLAVLFHGAGKEEPGNAAAPGAGSPAAKKLNVLFFTADDLDRNSLGCYGAVVPDVSPNLDRFARQAMLFKKAYVNSSWCVPSRRIFATGLYIHNNGPGEPWTMRGPAKTPLIMEVLRSHNYAVGIMGKVGHSTPKNNFEWDYTVHPEGLGDGRSPQQYYLHTKAFIDSCKKSGKPFYLMVNSHDPHRPFFDPALPLQGGAEKPSRIYRPDEITVPGFVPDLPLVRKELSCYYNSTRRLDDTFGKVMQALEESGEAENTLIIFLSDNGIAIPFAKCNAYEASNRTPLIIKWPGVTVPGSVNDQDYVPTIDFYPTVLDALDIPSPLQTDGQSFLSLLKREAHTGRNAVYTEVNYKSGGEPVPMRGIINASFSYIFNAWSDGKRIYRNNNEGLTLEAMQQAAKTDNVIAARVKTLFYREPEELYDLQKDPHSLHNLIHDPQYLAQANAFRSEMTAWMQKNHDPLLAVYQNRDKPAMALEAYYRIYPEAKILDQSGKLPGKKNRNDTD